MPFVLISHAAYPSTRDPTAASLSKKVITDLLRKRVGYTGLVVSDDLEMGAVLETTPIEDAAIAHIHAGGDLCLICRTEELIVRAYEAVLIKAEKDQPFRAASKDNLATRRTIEGKTAGVDPVEISLSAFSNQARPPLPRPLDFC